MRLLHTWIAALIAITCVAQGFPHNRELAAITTPGGGSAPSSILPSATTGTLTDATISPSLAPTQTASSDDRSQTASSSTTPTSTTAPVTSTVADASTTPTPTSPSNNDVLPIQPSITPAIAIAGVILIVGGLVLCFVGIKNRSVQIFLSTSLLVALGIEVLIIYVMNPPVSNAVQGGYLVAGVVGGAIIGGIAMIFKEVTEGLGCVLGGFSFAMWLLVLAPGGTIKSDSGRIILIAVFCVVCFSLSFSHYTRHYGIIACTSFAGATVFILGVDCYSRAGLKEFWLYIWDLNPEEFPLGTVTYPFTRYIRVEIALNVIVAVLGVMSQIKLWKIVRESRAQRDAERLQDEESRDQMESEIGRDLEARNRRDRAHWEGTYGGKDATNVQVDSAIGSSIDGYSKDSTDVMEREVETIELSDFPDPSKRSNDRRSNPLVRIRPASVESKSEQRLIGTTLDSGFIMDFDFDQRQPEPQRSSYTLPSQSSTAGLNRGSLEAPRRTSVKSANTELEVSKPVLEEKRMSVEDGTPIHDRRGISLQQLSTGSELPEEIDDGMHSPFEDDRASSIAATAAEDPDLDALSEAFGGSRAPSPYVLTSARNSMLLNVETPLEEDDEEILQRPVSLRLTTSKPTSLSPIGPVKESAVSSEEDASRAHTDAAPVANLSEHLPQKLSRAASQYRTTEWAKEAGRAEPEPVEELSEPTLDGVRVDMKSAAEAARAEENNASQKPEPATESLPELEPEDGSSQGPGHTTNTELAALQMPDATPPSRDSTQSLSRNPYRQSMGFTRQSLSATPAPAYAHHNASHVSLQRTGSSSSQLLAPRRSSNPLQAPQTRPMLDGSRNASAPLISQTVLESPAEDSQSPMNTQSRLSMTASNLTLMDVREQKLKKRVTSTSFNVMTATPSTQNLTQRADSQPTVSEHGSGSGPFADGSLPDDEEEMTLAERKVLVREQVRRQSGSSVALPRPPSVHRLSQPNMPNWPLSTQPPPPTPQSQQMTPMNSGSQKLIYDSHQPRRTSAFDQTKAGQNWSAWQSQKAAAATQRTAMLTTDGQMEMLRQQRAQKDLETRQRTEQQQAIQAQMDAHMRMGGMHDAHRNALSRMQNKANKHASVQGN